MGKPSGVPQVSLTPSARTESGPYEMGQVSAPFEVLIAVILMGFVLFAGYNAIQQLESQSCANTVNSQLEKMAQNLQNVATGKGASQFTFSFGNCSAKINDCKNFGAIAGESDIECIQLVDSTDPNICSTHCPSARSICSLLVYKSAKKSTIIKCVDISPSTVFPSQGSSQCIDRSDDGFVLRDFTSETIQQGTYSMSKASDLTGSVPIVCAYLKVNA